MLTTRTKLTTLFRDYYQPLSLVGGRPATEHLYLTYFRHLERFLGRPPVIADLTDETIGRYRAWRKTQGRCVCTVNGEVKKLLSLWRYVCRLGILKKWPTIKLESEPLRIPMAFLTDELARLFAACATMQGTIDGVPAGRWWFALLSTMWDSGERISAIMQLRWQDIDLRTGWLVVPAIVRKGHSKDLSCLLHPDTLDALSRIQTPKRKIIFAWPYTASYIFIRYSKVLDAAGLPSDRRSKFHRVRRSFASHAEAAGLNATELLDHSSRRVTVNCYLDPRIITRKHASGVLFRPGAGPQGI